MNIVEETKHLFKISDVNPSERVKVFQLVFKQTANLMPQFDELIRYYGLFNNRDQVSIMITNPDEKTLKVDGIIDRDPYEEFLSAGENDDELTVSIYVDKKIVNETLSIYCYKLFTQDLLNNSFSKLLVIIAGLIGLGDRLVFDVLDENVFWCTKTIAFVHDQSMIIDSKVDRNGRLQACKENCIGFPSQDINLLPDDFYIVQNYIDNAYYECFSKICSLLSVGYIASFATLSDNGVSGQINGQRNISFDLSFDKTNANSELYKIFDWIFSEGNSTDKLLLSRNVISLHCKYTSIDATDEKTFASIKSNYQLYLKENANQYIEAKNKLSEYICDVVAKLGDDISGLLSGLKNNMIAIVSFFLTVVLVNIVSEQPLNNIFTKEITVIIELILAGSVAYFLICRHEIQLKRRKNKRAYSILKENYKDVFSDEELSQIFNNDKLIVDADKELRKGIAKYSVLWCLLLILILIAVELISVNPIIIPICKSIFSSIKHWFVK